MWKVGAAVAVASLLLILLAIQFRPGSHRAEGQPPSKPAVQPLSEAALRTCTRQVLKDWVRDDRIRGGYPRQCYRVALDMVSRADTNCTTAYSIPLLCEALEARLQSSG